jgi:hypothetical protein
MAYQVGPDGTTRKGPISRWWWLSLLIGWIVFFIIGAALLGTWSSGSGNVVCGYDSYDGYDDNCSATGANGLFYGGVACFAIGGVLKLAYWIMLIIWCTQRRRYLAPVVYVNGPAAEAGKPYYPPQQQFEQAQVPSQYAPVPSRSPDPNFAAAQSPEIANGDKRFCGQCGTTVTSQFCTQCGTRI